MGSEDGLTADRVKGKVTKLYDLGKDTETF